MRFMVLFAVLIGAVPALAASRGGKTFADTVEVAGETLVLNGLGIREATVFNVDVYVAGLYVRTKSANARDLVAADEPKQILLKFVRDVDLEDLADAFTEAFKKNKTKSKYAKELKKLNGWMTSMTDKDTLSLTYVPGTGTEVRTKGSKRGVIAGAGFASALWSVWLGPNPPNSGLKAGMLGKKG